MKRIIVTPLFLILSIALALALLTAINGLLINNEGGNSLGGGFALIIAAFLFGILILE